MGIWEREMPKADHGASGGMSERIRSIASMKALRILRDRRRMVQVARMRQASRKIR